MELTDCTASVCVKKPFVEKKIKKISVFSIKKINKPHLKGYYLYEK
jgi:hypothetical protein